MSCSLRTTTPYFLQVKRHVEDVMRVVELDVLRGALVGVPGQSGLSVESRKRPSIAVGQVANPSVIFMDEPTSGTLPKKPSKCTPSLSL